MNEPQPLSVLRLHRWSTIPSSPGVYWWYFPVNSLDLLGVTEMCERTQLKLRFAPDGKVCLYHGLAKNLAQRVEWHAAQKLSLRYLQSGFLSTFRLSLLALNDFDYSKGAEQIDRYFDSLSVQWQPTISREQAAAIEHAELKGQYHYPLNIQGNNRKEVLAFIQHLKLARRAYKRRYT